MKLFLVTVEREPIIREQVRLISNRKEDEMVCYLSIDTRQAREGRGEERYDMNAARTLAWLYDYMRFKPSVGGRAEEVDKLFFFS